jgi:hypothetical protein
LTGEFGEGGMVSVEILDFDGSCHVDSDRALLARLRSVRRGPDGAFILSHDADSSLWVHINGEAAFLSFFPTTGRHPPFVPDEMWPGEHRDVRFLLVGGDEADAITVPWWQLVPVEVAYKLPLSTSTRFRARRRSDGLSCDGLAPATPWRETRRLTGCPPVVLLDEGRNLIS